VAVPGTDLTILLRVKWGEYRKLASEIADKNEIEALPAANIFLGNVLADVRGLTDEDDQPLAWMPELLDELPPGLVMQMFSAVLHITDTGAAELPLPQTGEVADSATSPDG
jgi:hypothetical protein